MAEEEQAGRSRKRSSLGEDLATRSAHALKKARVQEELDLVLMKDLVAQEWLLVLPQVQAGADNKETEFVWSFNYDGLFRELKPEACHMREALPDDLVGFHCDAQLQNFINIGHDKIKRRFNVCLYWAPRAHEILKELDRREAASSAISKA